MGKLTKNQKLAAEKIEAGKAYSLKEAASLVKEITFSKFDASLDIDVRLGVDPRKANQMVRGVVSLPHGTGKEVRVLVLCTPDAEAAAKEAGADYVGLDEYIEKIKGGWTDIDVIITMPSIMGKIGALGRVLGPRGLMPNPKSGTVTMDAPAESISQPRIIPNSSSIVWQRLWAFTARPYSNIFSCRFEILAPVSDGRFSRSCPLRSGASTGVIPVIHLYMVAHNPYTSVHGPCISFPIYCSSGAYPFLIVPVCS